MHEVGVELHVSNSFEPWSTIAAIQTAQWHQVLLFCGQVLEPHPVTLSPSFVFRQHSNCLGVLCSNMAAAVEQTIAALSPINTGEASPLYSSVGQDGTVKVKECKSHIRSDICHGYCTFVVLIFIPWWSCVWVWLVVINRLTMLGVSNITSGVGHVIWQCCCRKTSRSISMFSKLRCCGNCYLALLCPLLFLVCWYRRSGDVNFQKGAVSTFMNVPMLVDSHLHDSLKPSGSC